MPIKTSVLNSLQKNTKNIRNICILAHVDHGKTTLSDSLISSNGIISSKSAGKVRYLDNRPDEIARLITMKSSCISLLYQEKALLEMKPEEVSPEEAKEKSYLVNLIDSPGHVDFSSEVSTAVRVCDGGLIVVDAVEGVCIQTHTVLKQAWNEKVRPCLIINKVDRLINELDLTPLEAYEHLKRVLEEVNAIVGTLFSQEWFQELELKASQLESEEVIDYEEKEEEKVYFSPEKGNVVFASAYDGWAFRVNDFCEMYAKKLGVKASTLQKTLWGDFFFNPKTKKIHQKNPTGKLIPMFVAFALNNIWEVYKAAAESDIAKVEKIVNALKLDIPKRELNNPDSQAVVSAICSRWLPISHGVLGMVVQIVPNPMEAQSTRIQKLWQSSVSSNSPLLSQKQLQLEAAMKKCDKDSEEVVVFVSKVFPADNSKSASTPKARTLNSSGDQSVSFVDSNGEAIHVGKGIGAMRLNSNDKFVGFARVFCGTISVGQTIQVLGPRYNPLEPEKHRTEMVVSELFLLMGRNLEKVESVPAGNVFGIGGIEENIIKTATLSTTPLCSVFNAMTSGSSPIVRVAVESESPLEMPQLIEGLKILNSSDPSVQVLIQETGEHVIVASGELHLERCLKDLKDWCSVEFRVSPPIVAFRETVTNDPSLRMKPNLNGVKTPNKMVNLKISAIPIPENIRQFLEKRSDIIRKIFVEESTRLVGDTEASTFREEIRKEFEEAGSFWLKELDNLWAFGPRKVGANILLNHIPDYSQNPDAFRPLSQKMASDYNPKNRKNKTKQVEEEETKEEEEKEESEESEEKKEETKEAVKEVIEPVTAEERLKLLKSIENSIFIGFQAATTAGPLCEEPMSGVCFIVEDITFLKSNRMDQYLQHGPLGGQIISAMKQACRQAFLEKSARLLEPVYTCDIQVTSEWMGKVYSVLGRRRSKILNETMKENSVVLIEALLPAIESFGLSEELLKSTSGAASTQLLFNGFEILDQDPYFVATTEEELEDIGSNLGGEAPNIAMLYINNIRRRKGLRVEEKLVEKADKQRNISRNK